MQEIKRGRFSLDTNALIDLFFESFHIITLHYAFWFNETEHQLGLDKALTVDEIVWPQVLSATVHRITTRLKENDNMKILATASKETLVNLLEDMAKNWLAIDGFWFQAIERNFDYEMYTAKRTNDSVAVRFHYTEAKLIKRRLNLPENGGLPALKEALKYRQYALVNKQAVIEETPSKFIFRMIDCRVQSARKRRGLPDYPCKSAGIMEYSKFAEGIDPRIKTRCIACPPDPHPPEWWCAWEFEI